MHARSSARAQTHTHNHTRARAHTHTHTHTHIHTRACTHASTLEADLTLTSAKQQVFKSQEKV